MNKYTVSIPYVCRVNTDISADSEEEAKEKARELADNDTLISDYVGNGGTDKLIGVADMEMSIEACEGHIEGEVDLSIEVYKI